jgi:hypothetical protein
MMLPEHGDLSHVRANPQQHRQCPPQGGRAPLTLARRLVWLIGCFALGLAIGFVGFHFTASSAWFIAIPAVLAVGWFAIADPTQCLAAQQGGAGEDRTSEKS